METLEGSAEENADKPKQELEGSLVNADVSSQGSDDVNVTSHSQEEEERDVAEGLAGTQVVNSSAGEINAESDALTESPTSNPDQLTLTGQQSDGEGSDKVIDQETGTAEVVQPSSPDKSKDEEEVVEVLPFDGSGTNSNVSYQTSNEEDGTVDDPNTVEDAQHSSSKASPSSSKEEANKDVVEKDMDEEVDDFFQSAQVAAKKFPGLDNVDLASDDDGQEILDGKGEKGGDEGSKEDLSDPEEQEIGPRSSDEGNMVAGMAKSPFKDYPINIGNYKVCRQVGPGVKECIVLETGEQIKCFSSAKAPASLAACADIQNEPVFTSSPRSDLVLNDGSPSTEVNQQPLMSGSSENGSENFEYMSFPDGSSSTIIAADPNLNVADINIGHDKQAFITENGIPVILDNAEDDVKINIQAEMDRLGKAIQVIQSSGDDLVDVNNASVEDAEELVGDVLSSGGDGEGEKNFDKDADLPPVKKHKRKKDKQRYYVLQPDRIDDQERNAESEINGMRDNVNNSNKNSYGLDLETDDNVATVGERDSGNANNNANVKYRLPDQSPAGVTKTSPSRSPRRVGAGYPDGMHGSRTHTDEPSDSDRYDDSSSLEASRLSTRYSRLDRGQHNASPVTSSKPVSWHEMFKMIEEQHRSQQQQQYYEHQRILQEMQDSMKLELSKQQDTLKDRLNKYNEMLEELSIGRHDLDRISNPSPTSQEDVQRDTSRTTLDGIPISLRYPPPLASKLRQSDTVTDSEGFEESAYDRTPVKRSLEKELVSPPRPADTSLSSSHVALGGDKQLRGGVYSSPMPLTKAKPKGSPKSSKSYDKSSHHHSPRDRVVTYQPPHEDLSYNAATLTSENSDLRQRCQSLEDSCHDHKVEIRELTQKMQGLERRAADGSERFETSQAQVVSLHSRLEELTEYAKERDCVAADMELKAKKTSESLQSSHKREKELTDSLQAAKVTIRKLVEKYEMMEKDHQLLKESHKDQEDALFASRKELRDINNKLSRMELENKQLVHEKDVLKHELTMARSSPSKTVFEDAIQTVTSGPRPSPTTRRGPGSRSVERTYHSLSQERNKKGQELSPPDSGDETRQSPIIKAERELQKLRESMANGEEFAPKLQRKFYGTDVPRPSEGYRGPSASSTVRHQDKTGISLQAPKSSSPRDKKGSYRQSGPAVSSRSSKVLRDSDAELTNDKRHRGIIKKSSTENGLTGGDLAIERVKAGEIISRPAWEDVYTSMAPARTGGLADKKHGVDVSNAMRELSLRERLAGIENLERKYDDLISEKKKYESALSRVRGQSQRREKELLETELDRVDRELGSIRMSLKRFHVLKSSI